MLENIPIRARSCGSRNDSASVALLRGIYCTGFVDRGQKQGPPGQFSASVNKPVRSFDNASLTDCSNRRLAPDAEAFTDGLGCFRRFADTGHAHNVSETAGGRAATEVKGARWVNIVLADVKRSIGGSYHAFKQAK
ncbi:MAG: transposase [Xanthomonadales bacterium]|nr:transposase [Xanthomonadales bacterium]